MIRTCFLAGVIGVASVSAASATTYTYTDITIAGSAQSAPAGVTRLGTVAGTWYDQEFTSHGFIFQGGTVTTFDYPIAGVSGTEVGGINDAGEIVGTYLDQNYTSHGFIAKPGTNGQLGFTSVDYPGSPSLSFHGVDNQGLVLGDASGADNAQLLVAYNGKSFSTLISKNDPILQGVSHNGILSGTYFAFTNGQVKYTPFLYMDGAAETLTIPAGVDAAAYGVNNLGAVVGYYQVKSGDQGGFIYSGGTITKTSVVGSTHSYLTGINDFNVVVGVAFDKNDNESSYVIVNGKSTAISVPGGKDTAALSIANPGYITGTYVDTNGVTQTFLATPK